MASVFKRGETWYVRWRGIDGWTQRATEAKSRSQAKAFAAELELEEHTARRARLRQTAGLVPVQDDLPGSFGALCRWWLDERCPEPSRDIEERRLRKHVLAAPIAALPLARVRSSDLENLLADLERKGAAAGSVNKLRAILHAVFNRARRAGRWVGENPVAATQPRKVPRRVYVTLSPEQLARMLEQIPDDWRPLFACGPALGLRKGELFALAKSDVDLDRGIITIARSHDRDTTKGGAAAVLPLPAPLRPWIEYQVKHAPGPLLFPAPDGSQRPREADPQKILRNALSRAGIAEGWEHRCRWCGHKERHQDREQRYCPSCLKRTDGTGKPAKHVRGRLLWPKALPLKMRFHDLRHTFATELLRQGVDVHRVQRLMRHSDVRVTTRTYSHLLVEDLRAAVDAHAPKPSVAPPAEPKLAAFLLHEGGSEANDHAEGPDNLRKLEAESGGRCRIRTCDPCRVKAVLYR